MISFLIVIASAWRWNVRARIPAKGSGRQRVVRTRNGRNRAGLNSSTFYEQLIREAFIGSMFEFEILCQKEICAKAGRKILVTLTLGTIHSSIWILGLQRILREDEDRTIPVDFC